MLKLMKYEFRKQGFSKLVMAILLLLFQIFLGYGLIVKGEDPTVIASMLLMFLAIGSMFFIAFESIDTFSKDLKTKNSYMLFMTPHTSYEIVASKVLCTGITLLAGGLIFSLLGALDIWLVFERFGGVKELYQMLTQLIQIDIEASNVAIFILSIVISWLNFILTAFLAITLSTTFLANKKGKGIISVLIFILINVVMSKIIQSFTVSISNMGASEMIVLVLGILLELIFTIAFYLCSAWMLENKVSV